MKPLQQRPQGLTLVELIVTLAVAIILTLIAAPMFNALMSGNEVSSSSNLLTTHMNLARSEAVKRGVPVTICPSGDGKICAGTTQWAIGWLVFQDDGATVGDVDPGEEFIAISPSLDTDVTIGSSHTYIRYLADGTVDLP